MLNKEKYANEIVEIATKGQSIAMDNKTKVICSCGEFGECKKCYFYEDNYPTKNNNDCYTNIEHWANSEYIEPKEFTEQERTVIKALDKIEWVAKQGNGEVWGYRERPTFKESQVWKGAMRIVDLTKTTSCEFRALHYYDLNPTSRAEILGGSEQWKD